MAIWKPDPTFYPSPRMAMKAPRETLAYVASFDPTRKIPDAMAVVDVDPASPTYSQIVGTVDDAKCRRRTAPFRLERLLAPACARTRRIPTSSAAIWSCRACAHRASTSSTPSPTRAPEDRQGDRAGGGGREGRLYAARIPSIAAPRAFTSPRWATPRAEAPGGVFLMDHETFDVRGRWEIDRGRSTSPTTHGGTSATTRWSPANGARPRRSRTASSPRCCWAPIRPQAALLGPAQAQAPAGDRLRRRIPARVRAAPGARSDQGLWLRQLRRQPEGSVLVDLGLVSRRRQVGGQEDHRNSGRARRSRTCCRPCSRASRPCRRSSPTSTCRWTTAFSTSSCWGTGDLHQYDVSDPVQPRSSPARSGSAASSRARRIPRRRTARSTAARRWSRSAATARRVYFTNSLYGAIDEQFYPEGIDGWMVKLDAKPDGGIAFDADFFVEWPKSASAAPGAARGRRLLVRLVLLSVRRGGALVDVRRGSGDP